MYESANHSHATPKYYVHSPISANTLALLTQLPQWFINLHAYCRLYGMIVQHAIIKAAIVSKFHVFYNK